MFKKQSRPLHPAGAKSQFTLGGSKVALYDRREQSRPLRLVGVKLPFSPGGSILPLTPDYTHGGGDRGETFL